MNLNAVSGFVRSTVRRCSVALSLALLVVGMCVPASEVRAAYIVEEVRNVDGEGNGCDGRFLALWGGETEGLAENAVLIDAVLNGGPDNSITSLGYSIAVIHSTGEVSIRLSVRGCIGTGPSGDTYGSPSRSRDFGYMALQSDMWASYQDVSGFETDSAVIFLNISPIRVEGARLDYTEYGNPSAPGVIFFVYSWNVWGWLDDAPQGSGRDADYISEEVPSPGATAFLVATSMSTLRRRRC